jgi:5-methylcytosine-specific restriction endonuclease McrA
MPFTDSIKDAAFRRAGGKCECVRKNHAHKGRCAKPLTRSTAQFHHIHAQSMGGHDGLSNCEVLCLTCHKQTDSYGR